jgi:Subtilase family
MDRLIVIVVSAGNGAPPYDPSIERSVSHYPSYLLGAQNRLFAPAMAANVVTVGAIANGAGLPGGLYDQPQVQAITEVDEPSPFTRIGPGVTGMVKPDLCDYGGTLIFDGVTQRLQKGTTMPSAGVLSLHNRPLVRLFTADSGTSFAAPFVAYKAGHILRRFPTASANFVRALLVSSAQVPENAVLRLQAYGDEAIRNVCGYGQPDLTRSLYSDDDRVVLYAEDTLDVDHFAVFEVPIVDEFRQVPGRRQIKVTLAFDPPVRHTRAEYLGIRMSYRLVRERDPKFIFEHYRQRTKAEGRSPELPARFNCGLEPGPSLRDKGTIQTSSFTFQRNVDGYGDRYYLVVRCEGQWATNFVAQQRYAVVVELSHKAEQPVRLYQRIRQRVRLPA